MPSRSSTTEKIYSGLLVAGIGDALGAPTEQYTMEEIRELYGEKLLDRFVSPPPDTFAGAENGKTAEITDDASQMYYLTRELVEKGPAFSNEDWIACLLSWRETSPKAGFMGPSTEALINALKEGRDPTKFGLIGTSNRKMTNIGATNGAAMRCAPVGMCFPGDIRSSCEMTLKTCLPSHDASVAIEAACAIASGTSIAMTDSATVDKVLDACFEGARYGRNLARKHGRLEAGPRFKARTKMALRIAQEAKNTRYFLERLEAEVGNSVMAAESVPCAIGIFAYANGDPWKVVKLATNIGNDSDSIAAMAGAMAGVLSGHSAIPSEIVTEFLAANDDFDLKTMSNTLSAKFKLAEIAAA
ncbi:ADP-ribosylglycohydrolase family protein [Aliiroseovarius sp. 2305UL8-7]|uniref:ADP-ribosylglycohydrolase family protein n=1 Tax=Aliiroseovarius conchicola TaxID=3121637 RepID=UPI0035282B02